MSQGLFAKQIAELRARIDALSKNGGGGDTSMAETIAGLRAAVDDLSAAQGGLLGQDASTSAGQAKSVDDISPQPVSIPLAPRLTGARPSAPLQPALLVRPQGILSRLAWVPIPLLVAAMAVFWGVDIRISQDFPRLMVAVDFCCRTLACVLVMGLAGRSFVRRGSVGLLLLGCGVAIWGASGLVATSTVMHRDANLGVTISNLGLWLAALCHLAGVLLTRRSARTVSVPAVWLGTGYGLALGAVGLITWLTIAEKLPVFFVEGQGGMPVRDLVLGSALAMLAATAALLWERNRGSRSPFARWYTLALLLIAVGVSGMMVQPARHSLLNWACRAAQYLSGIYMLIAAIASMRVSRDWGTPLEEALRESEEQLRGVMEHTRCILWSARVTGEAGWEEDVDGRLGRFRWAAQVADESAAQEVLPLEVGAGQNYVEAMRASRDPGDEMATRANSTGALVRGADHYVREFRCRDRHGRVHWMHEEAALRVEGMGQWRAYGVVTDISERKAAEEALRESEDRLRLALDAGDFGTWDLDLVTGQAVRSLRHDQLFGYQNLQPEWTLEIGLRHVLPEDRQKVEDAHRPVGGKTRMYVEGRIRRTDGSIGWIMSTGRFYYDAGGRPLRIVGVCADITARKQAEEALRESEERFRVAQELSPDGFAILRPVRDGEGRVVDFTFVYENAAIARINGTDPAVVVGRRLSEFMPAHSQSPFHEAHARVADTGETCIMERKYEGGDIPRPTWFRVVVVRTGQDIAILSQDITERKGAEEAIRESQERLTELTSNIHGGLWEATVIGLPGWDDPTEAEGRAMFHWESSTANEDAFRRMLDLPEVPGQGWKDALHEARRHDMARLDRNSRLALRAGLPGYEQEFTCRDRQGHRQHFREVVSIRALGPGRWRLYGLITKITEQKQIAETLAAAKRLAEEAQATAEAASKAKDQFIAVLSHELRTPLTPALAAVAVLAEDGRLPGDAREDLSMVRRNIGLEVRLIADLLDVSRIISGKLHLEKRPVDVASTLREAAQIVSGDLDAKGQTLTLETPEAPYRTFADAARLQQVFWNLLRNASKFSPERSGITVRAKVVAVDHCPLAAQPCPIGLGECPLPQAGNGNGQSCGQNLIIEVTDEGLGIPADTLPKLFNAFEQDPKARSFGGLGLGLSICKAVVEMHGGTIFARSAGAGCGATFTVQLPVAQCPLPQAREAGRRGVPGGVDDSPKASPSKEPEPLSILLVEDHPDTAKLMGRLLRGFGFEVQTAGSVADGLTAIRQHKPDVLISDMGLPDGSGLDLIRQMRAEGHSIPAIALSGYGAPSDIENSRAAGFTEHLVKPLGSVDMLLAAITRLGVGGGTAGRAKE